MCSLVVSVLDSPSVDPRSAINLLVECHMIVLLNATMLLYMLQLTTVQQCGEQNLCHALMQSKTELVGTSLVLGDTHQMLQ